MVTSIENLKNSTHELKSEKGPIERNLISIPNNASVREEFIKCGKISCSSCPHGPYHYAYWKNNGKLKKKYLGTNKPRTAQEKSKNSVLTLFGKGKRDNTLLTLISKQKPNDDLLTLISKRKHRRTPI
jgi:hypothetical protein